MKKLIFTNGCFDLLHVGHIRLLEYARSLGDFLIVGLNSDDSVELLKGKDRPIIPFWERKEILEGLECVNQVMIFHEPNPYNLIKLYKPDILVKGGDWKGKKVIGSDLVKEVKFFPYQKMTETMSTTKIIEKIKRLK